MRGGHFFSAAMPWALFGTALTIAPARPAAAAPSCTFAQPFASVAKAYKRVVRAKPAVRTTSRTEGRWAGQILLTDLRFNEWPKGEARPASLTIDFEFVAEDGCPYYPDPFHRYYVLERTGGRFAIVNASERRR
ncbi:MAG TPA: hypothetical protein VGB04_13810 [Allosphingosinicella sp.]|jgi:hypothetical protein